MNEILNIWDIIVKTNTFNFAVLVLIFAIIIKKANIGAAIEKIKDGIIEAIKNAEEALKSAKSELSEAQKSVKNLEKDTKNIIDDATKKAEQVAQQIGENAKEEISQILNNAEKIITAEEKTTSATLMEKTSNASIEVAKAHIISTLDKNSELHDKYIRESIEELDRIKI